MSCVGRRGRWAVLAIGVVVLAAGLVIAGLLAAAPGSAGGQLLPQAEALPCPQPSPGVAAGLGVGGWSGVDGQELLVAGGSEGLLLLAEDGALLRTLSCAQPDEPIMAVAVRPGSTPEELTVAMAVRNASKDVLVLTLAGDRQVVHSRTPAGVSAPEFPSLQWSPDGAALVAATGVDAEADVVTLAIDEHPLADAGAPPPRGCRVEGLSGLEGATLELERWTDRPGGPEEPAGIGLRAEDGQGYTVDPGCTAPPTVVTDEVPGDARVLRRSAPLGARWAALVGTVYGGDIGGLRLTTSARGLPLPRALVPVPAGAEDLALVTLDDAVVVIDGVERAWRIGDDRTITQLPRLVRTADRVD